MTVDITTPNGKEIYYAHYDVIEAEARGEEVAECDRCGTTEIAELLVRRGGVRYGVRYCEHCDGDMYRR